MFNMFSNQENKITNISVHKWDHSDHQPVLSLILRPIKLCIVVIILIKLLHHSLLEPCISRSMLSRVLIKGPGVQQLVFIIRAQLRPVVWAESKTCKQTSQQEQHKISVTITGIYSSRCTGFLPYLKFSVLVLASVFSSNICTIF